jgi:hypothetical protein
MWLNAQPAYRFKAGVIIGVQILSVLRILHAGIPKCRQWANEEGKFRTRFEPLQEII